MLLAYVVGFGQEGRDMELCLVPDKPDSLSKPIPIASLMFPTTAGVVRVGPDEGAVINVEDDQNTIVITAVVPAAIYLTHNLPSSPGFKAKRIRIVCEDEGVFRTFYDRERGRWDEWIANKERD